MKYTRKIEYEETLRPSNIYYGRYAKEKISSLLSEWEITEFRPPTDDDSFITAPHGDSVMGHDQSSVTNDEKGKTPRFIVIAKTSLLDCYWE